MYMNAYRAHKGEGSMYRASVADVRFASSVRGYALPRESRYLRFFTDRRENVFFQRAVYSGFPIALLSESKFARYNEN